MFKVIEIFSFKGGIDRVEVLLTVGLYIILGVIAYSAIQLWIVIFNDLSPLFNYLDNWYYWVIQVPAIGIWDILVKFIEILRHHQLTKYPNLNTVLSLLSLLSLWFIMKISYTSILGPCKKISTCEIILFVFFMVYVLPVILTILVQLMHWFVSILTKVLIPWIFFTG